MSGLQISKQILIQVLFRWKGKDDLDTSRANFFIFFYFRKKKSPTLKKPQSSISTCLIINLYFHCNVCLAIAIAEVSEKYATPEKVLFSRALLAFRLPFRRKVVGLGFLDFSFVFDFWSASFADLCKSKGSTDWMRVDMIYLYRSQVFFCVIELCNCSLEKLKKKSDFFFYFISAKNLKTTKWRSIFKNWCSLILFCRFPTPKNGQKQRLSCIFLTLLKYM